MGRRECRRLLPTLRVSSPGLNTGFQYLDDGLKRGRTYISQLVGSVACLCNNFIVSNEYTANWDLLGRHRLFCLGYSWVVNGFDGWTRCAPYTSPPASSGGGRHPVRQSKYSRSYYGYSYPSSVARSLGQECRLGGVHLIEIKSQDGEHQVGTWQPDKAPPAKAEVCEKFPDKETAHHPSTPNDKTDDPQDRGPVDQNGEWICYPHANWAMPGCP